MGWFDDLVEVGPRETRINRIVRYVTDPALTEPFTATLRHKIRTTAEEVTRHVEPRTFDMGPKRRFKRQQRTPPAVLVSSPYGRGFGANTSLDTLLTPAGEIINWWHGNWKPSDDGGTLYPVEINAEALASGQVIWNGYRLVVYDSSFSEVGLHATYYAAPNEFRPIDLWLERVVETAVNRGFARSPWV